MAEAPEEFAGVLRTLRTRARLTQQELADAAGLALRTVSNLERAAGSPQKETLRLLGDALGLLGAERERFEAAARGRFRASLPLAAAASAMRSLPRDIAGFTGRQRELEQLAKAALTAGGVVGIHAIGGMAGVGKTAFAVHAGYQLSGQFPGGQIFLQLHGHTPGRAPVEPPTRWRACCSPSRFPRRRSRRGLSRGRRCGGTGWPGGRCCWCWCLTTRQAVSRCGRCCREAGGAWCW